MSYPKKKVTHNLKKIENQSLNPIDLKDMHSNQPHIHLFVKTNKNKCALHHSHNHYQKKAKKIMMISIVFIIMKARWINI